QEAGGIRVRSHQRAERGARLAGGREGDEHQGAVREAPVPDGGGGLGAARADGLEAGEGGDQGQGATSGRAPPSASARRAAARRSAATAGSAGSPVSPRAAANTSSTVVRPPSSARTGRPSEVTAPSARERSRQWK